VRRRAFIGLLGSAAVAWPRAARAQQHKTLRVGFVGMQPRQASHYKNFLKRMAEFGYEEGRNLPSGPMFLRDRAAIAQTLLERRIPSIAAFRENMEAGALISYGCVGVREDGDEASVGEGIGQPLSRESQSPGADAVSSAEGNTFRTHHRKIRTTRRGRRTWHVQTLPAREPGDLAIDRSAIAAGPHREGEEP
jgi:hypothetical protein